MNYILLLFLLIPRKSSLSSTEESEMVEMIDTSSKKPMPKSKTQSKSET